MIGIIGAMRVEVEGLCSLIENCTTKHISGREFYIGKINKSDVVIVESGVGKVNAALATAILCQNFDIDLIINTGVAGGVGNIKPLDLVIADKFVYHDFDLTPIGYQKGVIPGLGRTFDTDEDARNLAINIAKKNNISFRVGNIASGDIFATKLDILNGLDMEISAVEMEGAAIAHAAKTFNKRFIALRVISDVLESENQSQSFAEVEKKAAEYAILFVFEIINKLVLTK